MDLCCLIDSEDRLPATALVNMLGDLFARGMQRSIHSLTVYFSFNHRDKVPHQAATSRTNTDRQALPGPEAWPAIRDSL